MYFISLTGMWWAVFFFRKQDHLPADIFSRQRVLAWSFVHFAVFLAIDGRSDMSWCTAVAAAYLVGTAMLDVYTGFVYSIFSFLSFLACFFLLFFKVTLFDISGLIIFFLYLKILERCRVFGGGDTEYLWFVYCFNRLWYGKRAEFLTVCLLIAAVLLHTLCHRKSEKGSKPFTPQILAVFGFLYVFIS